MFADKTVIKSLIFDLIGVPCVWDPAEPNPFVSPSIKGQIFLHAKAMQGLGVDEFVREWSEGDNKQIVTQSGNRLFTLTIKMESYVATVNAYETLEKLRNRIWRPSSLARLRAANMTVATAEGVVDLPTNYDTRVISVASLDLHMALRFHEVDDSDDGNIIETFDLNYEYPS